MVPLSGASSADGNEFRNGLILAIEELNARGGILGRPLEPYFIDTSDQSAETVSGAARELIRRHNVHAIVNGYNIGAQNAEYEPIADAGVIYVHHNTLLQHHDTVMGDPERYFGCFMSDPAEYWYGQGFIKFISWLRDTGQWRPESNRLAIISGSRPYSIVTANAMRSSAADFGWSVAFGPEIVKTPTTDWRAALDRARETRPAIIANTHFYASDIAHFQRQFMQKPINCLVYLQYGGMHQTFIDVAGQAAEGVIVGTVVGLVHDDNGAAYSRRYRERFGANATPEVGALSYSAMHHYALAASVAGGTGAPYEFTQNRKLADRLKDITYRSVLGTIHYHPKWQAAVPYPDATRDPSRGMPHLFYQVQDYRKEQVVIAPVPYNTGRFQMPPWHQSPRPVASYSPELLPPP
ncbi:MAG: amino acid ABC transporter substrate-binding protein [Ancylobacter novellus]|uniref:Amino acid ABC transporter substrate-binding protein n=1 Tax=Ancylobacter novellus TaxID=921 RepID=A0A2W5KGF8_ANCNO|nr:MAG: amino acid ABC transporter substrate-binding protein [Ancylobacter novellus]